MKRQYLILSVFLVIIISLNAQKPQIGVVRSVCKPGKTVEYLAGAHIKTSENLNEATSLDNGYVEIPVKTVNSQRTYTIVSVSLPNYVVDQGILNKQRSYSLAPIEILMISKEEEKRQREAYRQRILAESKKEYDEKFEQLQGKYDEIEQLNNEYTALISSVPEFVQKLLFLDYRDLSDTLDIQIAEAWENGEFLRAAQLINQKPSIEWRIDDLRKDKDAEKFYKERAIEKEASIIGDLDKKIFAFKLTFQKDSVLKNMKNKVSLDSTNIDFILDIGYYFEEYCSEYDSALFYYRKALKKARNIKDDKSIAKCYANIGDIYSIREQRDEALVYFQKALAKYKALYGENHESVAKCYNAIGNQQRDLSEASLYYQNAYDIIQNLYGEEHEKMVDCHLNLGWVQFRNGYYVNALGYFHKALAIGKLVYSVDDIHLARTYSSLGDAYAALWQSDSALCYHQKALKIRRLRYGEHHPSVADSYLEIGNDNEDWGHYKEADSLYKLALNTYMQIFGESHPLVATCYSCMANVYYSRHGYGVWYSDVKDDYDTAMKYWQEALDIYIATYGEEDPFVASIYLDLAEIKHRLGQNDEAIYYIKQSLKINEKNVGNNHPRIASYYMTLGNIYSSKGEYNTALKYDMKAYSLYRSFYVENDPVIADICTNIGIVYNRQEEFENALEYLFKALEIYKAAYGDRHQKVGDCYNNIGRVYFNMWSDNKDGAAGKALGFYIMDLEIKDSIFGQYHPKIIRCRKDIAELYYSAGWYESALEEYVKVIEINDSCKGQCDRDVLECYENMGLIQESYFHDYETAYIYYQNGLNLVEKIYEYDNIYAAWFCERIGDVLWQQNDSKKALEYYQKALSIYEIEKGERNSIVIELKNKIEKVQK